MNDEVLAYGHQMTNGEKMIVVNSNAILRAAFLRVIDPRSGRWGGPVALKK